MKQLIRILALSALCAAIVPAAGKKAGGTKGGADVMSAMEAWKTATIKGDTAALQTLLADDLSYTHSSGKNETKKDVIDGIAKGTTKVQSIEWSNSTVRNYGKTAVVKADVKIVNAGTAAPANLNILFVWVKNSTGAWQMSARQAIRLTQ